VWSCPVRGTSCLAADILSWHRVSDVRRYALMDTVLEGLESEAREARNGLRADPQPVPPWEYRKQLKARY